MKHMWLALRDDVQSRGRRSVQTVMGKPSLHRREESRTAYPDVTHPLIVSLDDVPSTEQMADWPGKSSRLDGRCRLTSVGR